MFDYGSFHVDGSANISNTEVLYQLQRCAKGTLNEVSLNVIDAMSYQEWQYQTSRGISATLALGPGRALILADLSDNSETFGHHRKYCSSYDPKFMQRHTEYAGNR